MSQDQAPSTQHAGTSSTESTEKRERTLLLTKLMALYPSRPGVSPEMVLTAYLDETSEVPLPWLREGLRGFRTEPGRVFLPSISEVLTACAKRIRSERLKARGQTEHNTIEQKPLDVAGILNWAVRHVPLGMAQLAEVCGKDKPRLAIEAQNRRNEYCNDDLRACRRNPMGRDLGADEDR